MLNIVMNALAKGFFRAFLFFCVWFLGYLIWRFMHRGQTTVRPLWLDILVAAGIAGFLGAVCSMRYHRLDVVVSAVVFAIGVWIAWSGWKKRKPKPDQETHVGQQQPDHGHIANPYRQDRH